MPKKIRRERLRKELTKGTPVMLRYDREARGEIWQAGVEVSEIRFDNGQHRFIPNRHIIRRKMG